MDLSISIVSWNTRDLLDECVRSVYETTEGIEFEVIVVDNASSDGSAEMIAERYPGVTLIANSENTGFARANNQALAVFRGSCFVLLNPDTVCHPGALASLVEFLKREPGTGAVGPLVVNPDGTLQYSWARFPSVVSEVLGRLDRRPRGRARVSATAKEAVEQGPFEVDWVGGVCMAVRRDTIEHIGLMDERLFMYSEETDWCLRMRRAGWRVFVEPRACVVHHGGRSSSQAPVETLKRLADSKIAYFSKHHGAASASAVRTLLGLKAAARAGLKLAASARPSGRGEAVEESRRQLALFTHLLTGEGDR